jgi:transcriptional regulator with XRE-family HTH domain
VETFRQIISAALEHRGVSPLEAAKKLGIVHSYLYEIVSGKVPPPSARIVRKFAKLLRIDYKLLLTAAELDKIAPDVRETVRSVYEDGIRFRFEKVR